MYVFSQYIKACAVARTRAGAMFNLLRRYSVISLHLLFTCRPLC